MPLAAVVIPCASRKRWAYAPSLGAATLPKGPQKDVAGDWLRRVGSAPSRGDARDLYMGRGFSLGLAAAATAATPLFVVSAGLGLVEGRTSVPAYGLTVGARADDSVAARVEGRFNPQEWWAAVRAGPFSSDWQAVFARDGLVLVALSQAYARMVAGDLAALDGSARARLRLFGTGLEASLPEAFARQVMPYDARFDSLHPGTRTDLAQRALAHFARSVAASEDPVADAAAVRASLSGHRAPQRAERPRADDEFVIGAISRHLESVSGIGRILKRVREHDRIACEQRRFTRLYRVAQMRSASPRAGVESAAGRAL